MSTLKLLARNIFLCLSWLMLCFSFVNAQITFEAPDDACLEEHLILTNVSHGYSTYEWDLCEGDLLKDAISISSSEISANLPLGNTIIKANDKWYGFVCDRSNSNRIFRLDFGSSLLNSNPTVTDLGNLGGKLDNPQDINIIEYQGNYFGFVHNLKTNKLIRINFGNNIENTSASSDILVTGKSIDNTGIDIIYDGTRWVVALTYTNFLTLVDLGTSPANIPTASQIMNTTSIGGINGIGDIKYVKEQGQIYGFITGMTSKTVYRLNFGSNAFTDPVVQKLTIPELTSSQPYGIVVERDNGKWIVLLSTVQGNLVRLNIGDDITNNVPTYTDLGKFGTLGNNLKLDIAKSESKWVGLTTNWYSKKFFLIEFTQAECPFDKAYSLNSDTVQLQALKSDTYYITLRGKDSNGLPSSLTKSITVSDQQAPQVDIEYTACFGEPTQFSLISDTELTSISWDFDADGITDANTAEVSYTYPSIGNYSITLEVESENGCSNRITKEITIYETPDPSFSIPSGTICSNGAINFTNLTDTKGADDLITYHWDFNGEGIATTANPSFTFATGGTKTVTLTASIPGCSETYTKTIEIAQGPIVNFNVPYICQGVEVQFENLTSGADITEYHWDFGNGESFTTTSAEPPFYTYQTEGVYTATLAVKNAIGCNNVASKTFTVYARPQVNFLAEVACSGSPVRFIDQTTAGTTSNVVDWQWDFGDGSGTANIRHPEYTYTQPGTYLVKLVAQTSTGCKDSLVQEVIVESPVTPDFSYHTLCDEQPYTLLFNDASTVEAGDKITAWLWHIQGESFASADVQYTFEAPGTYEVTLTTFAASACNATLTRTIEVMPRPEVTFTYTAACVGEPFTFHNTTGSEEGVVSSYTWDFGGAGASFEANPQFTFTEPGTYMVKLTAQTLDHCTFSSAQTIHVEGQPVAKFMPSATYGAYPLTVQLDNQSEHATQYAWYIGAEDTLTEASPAYTFTQPGQYEVVLVAENASGCISSENQLITVVEPVWDMVLENMMILPAEDNGAHQVVLTIRNAGTVTVTRFPISIKVDQLLELKENFEGTLAPGEKISYPVSFTLSSQVNRHISIGYICATLLHEDASLPDDHLSNNRLCVNMTDAFSSLIPYPNPVKDVLDIALVLPQAAQVDIRVQSSQGKQLRSYSFTETRQGLNTFAVDMSGLAQGSYLVQVHYLGKTKIYRVVVHP